MIRIPNLSTGSIQVQCHGYVYHIYLQVLYRYNAMDTYTIFIYRHLQVQNHMIRIPYLSTDILQVQNHMIRIPYLSTGILQVQNHMIRISYLSTYMLQVQNHMIRIQYLSTCIIQIQSHWRRIPYLSTGIIQVQCSSRRIPYWSILQLQSIRRWSRRCDTDNKRNLW